MVSWLNSSASFFFLQSITDQLRRQKMSEVLNPDGNARILSFRQKAPAADAAHANNLKVLSSTGKPNAPSAAQQRQVSQRPTKILDAPDLLDDFYLHLLDWSSHNHLAVALHTSLFLWNAADGSIEELYARENDEEYPCCLR